MNILLVSPGFREAGTGRVRLPPFQQVDVELLSSLGHPVRTLLWKGRPFRDLWREARWADLVYCWNISDHAFVSSFVAERLACVVGGYDFADVPQCDYGNMRRWHTRLMAKHVWRKSDALLYVDPSLMDEASAAFGHPGRAHYVPTGYDAGFWTPGSGPRGDAILTVANAPVAQRIPLKGLDLFLEVADRNRDFEFQIVGEMPPGFRERSKRPNVTFYGFLEAESLRDMYRRAKVYCQLSLHEGLPNAVCEAMLCGCVPVGTAVNGIPNAIGDAGYIVDRDPLKVAEAIERAASDTALRMRARERIATRFPLERRKKALSDILQSLAG